MNRDFRMAVRINRNRKITKSIMNMDRDGIMDAVNLSRRSKFWFRR